MPQPTHITVHFTCTRCCRPSTAVVHANRPGRSVCNSCLNIGKSITVNERPNDGPVRNGQNTPEFVEAVRARLRAEHPELFDYEMLPSERRALGYE